MAGASNDAQYTDPELRHRLKEQIQAGDKGGRAGQWSARKAQLLVREYEKEGGGYTGARNDTQRHLAQWSAQDWHTGDGEAGARGRDGTARYLPDVAWQLLSAAEREATERPKRDADEQYVDNTDAAKHARAAAELLTLPAREAAKKVAAMMTADELQRSRTAEQEHGKARTTVLSAIDRRLAALQG